MEVKPSLSKKNRGLSAEYCTVCRRKVYSLEKHYQTEDHKRSLRHPIQNSWQDDWPKEEGLWWFYGWRYGKVGFGGDPRIPELCLVEVRGPIASGSFIYVTHGVFLGKV